ncbi:MAG: nucleotidyltransferase domain-containing protein [Ignavibacteriaceae bacterium]
MDSGYTKEYAIKKAKELAFILTKNGVKLHSVFLFGSFTNNELVNHEWSDIDIALVSDNFSGSRFDDNKRILPFVITVDPRIESHPFTLADFENSPFARDEIVAKGIKIN